MKSSLQANLPPMEVRPVDTSVSTARKSLDRFRLLVVRALGRAGLSQKHAAAEMGLNEAQLSRQLAGVENLSLWKLHELPPEFWQELLLMLAEYYEISLGQTPREREDGELGRAFRELAVKAVGR